VRRWTVDDLNEAERELVLAVLGGGSLDLAGRTETPEIRGELIREMMLGRFDWPGTAPADPRGIRLSGARLGGGLDLAEISSPLPLSLIGCHTAHPVRLTGASLSTVDFTGLVAPRLMAGELTVERSLTLRETRLGGGPFYAVHLGGARIGGVLNCSGARLVASEGPALQASGLHTGSGVFLNRGFHAEGTGELGVVRLPGAVIGTMLNLAGATLRNPDGPSLVADYLRTESNAMFHEGFDAQGTVRLIGAKIGGQLVCENGRTRPSRSGDLALDLSQVGVSGHLLLAASFPDGPLNVTGLTYGGRPGNATLTEWLEMLAGRTAEYASQPYFQLAKAHAGAGHERNVRRIHIARQKDLRRRGDLGLSGRVWHRIAGFTVGHGYRPVVALLWFIGTLAVSVVLTVLAGTAGLLGRCPVVEQVELALNAATPLVKAGSQRCVVDTGRGPGQAILAAGWILQVLSWAFLTLFVAGFTGLMRKSS
jgi:hypothetical protein